MTVLEQVFDVPVQGTFDYTGWDYAVAEEGRAIVDRVRQRTESFVIDTGRDLLGIKSKLEHGQFQIWIERALGFTARTARNYMSAAECFAAKTEIVSVLPPTLIYKLAADSTPEPVREQIVGELTGVTGPVSREQAQAISARIDGAKQAAKEEAAAAKQSPDERKKQAASKKAAEARRLREAEKQEAEWAARRAQKLTDAARLAELIVLHMPAEAVREVYDLIQTAAIYEVRTEILRVQSGDARAA